METQVQTSGKKSLKKNYFYNLAYQIFVLIVPLITMPYISRILREEGVGQYSYAYSLITYFTLFAAMGFGLYAQREVAKVQDDIEKKSKLFWEITIVRLIPVVFSLIAFALLAILGVFGSYTILMVILSINIVAMAFDINFLFQGNENFKAVALRNFAVKIASTILIFVFVKNESHVWIYTLCLSISLIGGNVAMWINLWKHIKFRHIGKINPMKHFIPAFRLFIPTIAISLYTVMDKSMMGWITGDDYSIGCFEQADKILKISLVFVTAIGTIMMPRNSSEIKSGNIDKVKSNINFSINYVLCLAFPLMFGIIALAPNLSFWFLGSGYDYSPELMMIMSPVILFIGLTNVIGLQILIPLGKDKMFTLTVTIGAIINIIISIPLIFLYWSYGAAIATAITEFIILIAQFIYARKIGYLSFKQMFRLSWKYLLSGLVMFAVIMIFRGIYSYSIKTFLLQVVYGAIIYFVILLILRDKFLLQIIKSILSIFKKPKINQE